MIFAHLIQTASNLPTDTSALESSISALESAISALESEVKTLESSSAPWEHSVWVFTFLVALGVAMELWIIRHEYCDDMEAWALAHFGVLRSPGRPAIKKLVVEVASVLLITIGVMGELVIGIKIGSINAALRGKSAELRSKNAELRSKSDQLLALVTQQAGNAALSAKTAHDEADSVRTEARAIKLQLDAVAKHAEALGLQLDFRGPRAELFNGTNITRPGVGKFLAKIKPFAGQKVEIRTNLSDIRDPQENSETRDLVGSLQFFIGQVRRWRVSIGNGGHEWGVEVVVNRKAPRETREAANALASGLGDVGLTGMQRQKPEVLEAQEGSETDRTNFAPDTILLFVGETPLK